MFVMSYFGSTVIKDIIIYKIVIFTLIEWYSNQTTYDIRLSNKKKTKKILQQIF